MKRITFLVMLAFIGLSVNAQLEFQKTLGSANADMGNYVQQTSDHGYIIAGYATNFIAGAGQDVYLVKTDSNGIMQWNKTYGGTNNEVATCVSQTNDICTGQLGYIIAGIVMTGTSYTYYNGFLIKTNSAGDTLWTRTYATNSYFNSVKQTNDGGFIVAGEFMGATYPGAYLLKTDNLGNVLWSKIYGANTATSLSQVLQTSDGNYIACGSNSSNSYGYILKVNTAGDTLWSKRYAFSGGGTYSFVNSIQQTMDGSYILGGTNEGGSNAYADILKINSTGNVTWNEQYGSLVTVNSIQQTSNDEYMAIIVNGTSTEYLLKITGTGNVISAREYNTGGASSFGCLQLTKDDGFVMVGQYSTHNGDVYLIKTDSSGISCNGDIPYLMSSTTASAFMACPNLINSSASSTTGHFSGVVNSPSPILATICTTSSVGIDEINNNSNNISIYPNPANTTITIENSNFTKEQTISVFDMQGQLINTLVTNNKKTSFDISSYPSGVYVIEVRTEKGVEVRKFIKE